jgi:hypothetical protein
LSARVLAESDNESVPTSTPTKKQPQKKNIHVKTLEEIRLERIQAESAAFYAYNSAPVEPEPDTTVGSTTVASGWDSSADNDLRAKILSRKSYRNLKSNLDFRVMTLDEIRKNRQQKGNYSDMDEKTSAAVSSSRDIPDSTLSAKQFSNQFENESLETVFQLREKRSVSDHSFEENGVVCGDDNTVTFKRRMGSENNGDTLADPVTQIQVSVRVGRDGTGTGEHLLQNYESNIVIKTLAQIRAEKNSVVENTSSCSNPKKRSHSPIVFDCLLQKLSCRNMENENDDSPRSVGEGKKKKPMIIRKHFLESGSNPDEKDSSCPPKKLRKFARRTLHQQPLETKTDSEDTPKRRQLQLRRSIKTAVPASERSRVIRLTSDSLKNSEVIVEVAGNVTSNVCSDLLETNGTVCLETEGPVCDRLEQPLVNISEDRFKSGSVSVTSSCVCDENSSTPLDIAKSDVSQDSDLSLQITRYPSVTSVPPGKHLDTSHNDLARNRVAVTQSSVLQSSERLESEMAFSTENADVLGTKGKDCTMKLLMLPAEQDSMDMDEDLLLGSSQDNSVTLDAEDDILQDIDDLLNDD